MYCQATCLGPTGGPRPAGRIVSIETVEDTQRLDRSLRALATAGHPEALAAPLND